MLKDFLVQKIQTHGPLRLDHFINDALYQDQWGYYRTHHPIGRTGDFITAPEICSLFGELIGLFFLDYWLRSGCPRPVRLVELGPGRGTLMKDILKSFQRRPAIFDHLTVHMIEVSPTLKELQQQHLKSYSCISWHSHLETVPEGFQLIVGNEFFDAFPIRQFWYEQQWHEQFVDYTDGTFFFSKKILESPPVDFIPSESCWVETSPDSLEYVNKISHHLKTEGGIGVFIDYGAAKTPWTGNSLQAMIKHQYCDVLSFIGEADITHHVDFSSLQQQFSQQNVPVYPLLTQREFLLQLGLETRLRQVEKNLSDEALKKLQLAIFRLIDHQLMGQLFKTLVVAVPPKNTSPIIPAGF